jgi:hypothetical protein
VVGGLGIGQLSATVPLYIAETSPTEIRGRLTSIYQVWRVLLGRKHVYFACALSYAFFTIADDRGRIFLAVLSEVCELYNYIIFLQGSRK